MGEGLMEDFKLKKEHQNKMMMKVNEELKKKRKEKKKVRLMRVRRWRRSSGGLSSMMIRWLRGSSLRE
jgi:hypothetical protein